MNGEEQGGYTILEFTRSLTTCDNKDLNVEVTISHHGAHAASTMLLNSKFSTSAG